MVTVPALSLNIVSSTPKDNGPVVVGVYLSEYVWVVASHAAPPGP
jgi:hypothetical protein